MKPRTARQSRKAALAALRSPVPAELPAVGDLVLVRSGVNGTQLADVLQVEHRGAGSLEIRKWSSQKGDWMRPNTIFARDLRGRPAIEDKRRLAAIAARVDDIIKGGGP